MSFLNLKSFWQGIDGDRYLLIALFLGLLLRGLNSTFGSPSLYISNDEAIAHLSAFNMIAQKTPVSIANYTPLGAYIQIPFLAGSYFAMKTFGLASSLSGFELFLLTHPGYFLFIPRLISAFFGTLLILVIYKITLELFERKSTAVVAAFLSAVSFNLVHISHFGRPWAAALFFFMLFVYFLVKNKTIPSLISVALSYGFHQVGILALPLLLMKLFKKPSFKNSLGLVFTISLIGLFSSLTLRTGFVEAIRRDQSFLKEGKFLADLIIGNTNLGESILRTLYGNLSVYFSLNLLVTDGVLLLFGTIGLFLYKAYPKARRDLIVYIALYFIFASLFFHPLLRYLLPVIILLIPFSAWVIDKAFAKKRYFVILILIIASINSVWWNLLFLKKPTFIRAHEWISKNIPTQVPIAYFGGRYMTFAPNAEAILHVQKVNENFHSRLQSINPDYSQDNVRNIVYISHFPGENKLDQLENALYDYKMAYVLDYYINPAERLYSLDQRRFEIVAHFNPTMSGEITKIAEPLFDATWNFPTNNFQNKLYMFGLVETGPFVDILKIKN